MPPRNKSNALDILRVICCGLIIGSHCLPLFAKNSWNYYYGQWFFRFCVPFFFISSGYYIHRMDTDKKKAYFWKIAKMYFISAVLYLPLYYNARAGTLLRTILFGYYHLWYLSALAVGVLLVCLMERFGARMKYLISALLYAVGVLFDEYYKLFPIPVLHRLAGVLSLVGGARHALFFAVPMLMVGAWISESEAYRKLGRHSFWLFPALWLLALGESIFLRHMLGDDISLDLSLVGWAPAIPLVFIGLSTEIPLNPIVSKHIRAIAGIVYIDHIWIMTVLRKFVWLHPFICCFFVVLVSFMLAVAFEISLHKVMTTSKLVA